jgi:hypothetical protein
MCVDSDLVGVSRRRVDKPRIDRKITILQGLDAENASRCEA